MEKAFDKDRLFRNINHLLKQQNKKTGWLEEQAGVSTGYISRASKETTAKPGIDFITKVASLLNVSLDVLVYTDLVELTPTEKYLCDFFNKLIVVSASDMVKWNMESPELFAEEIGDRPFRNFYHPLIENERLYVPTSNVNSYEVERHIFNSFNFGTHNKITGNCYNFELDNDLMLYIMNIKEDDESGQAAPRHAKEVWVCSEEEEPQFLCDNLGCKSLASVVDDLYSAAADAAKRPVLRNDIHSAIDDFMQRFSSDCNNNYGDGEDDEPLPF